MIVTVAIYIAHKLIVSYGGMIENLGRLRVAPEIAKFKSAYDRIDINGFTTIDRKVVGGDVWHKVKGWGDAPFDVLFNPDKQRWLKIVPRDAKDYKEKCKLLSEGAKIVRISLATSGLQNYADSVEECSVKIDSSSTVGFKTNHIGPTLDFINRKLSKNNIVIDSETAKSLSNVYIEAFNLAAVLYVEHGIWTADPNAGNVVLNFDSPDDVKVTLIDFEKPPQYRKINKNGFSDLFKLFKNEAKKSGISISKQHQGVVDVGTFFPKERMADKR